jgi:16S rRNA processing protein RimM
MAREYLFPADQFFLLGKIKSAHGLKGEVNILIFSKQSENIKEYRTITLVDQQGKLSRPLTVVQCRIRQDTAIVQFADIADRSGAEQTIGCGVLVAQKDIPPLKDGEYFWQHYLGKNVIDQHGKEIGIITRLFSNGAQDILVVQNQEEEYLLPLVSDMIVRENSMEVIMQLPEGLLDINRDITDEQNKIGRAHV